MNKTPICPICGFKNIKIFSPILNECTHCGLKFVAKIKSNNYYSQIYNKNYFNGAVYDNYLDEEKYRRRVFRDKIKLIKKHLPCEGTILDIGCGMGFFLMEMQKRGYQIKGLDISKYAAAIASAKLNTFIPPADLLSASFSPGQFDIITLWDLLEHLPEPARYLDRISQIIKKNGVLVIETLNISSLTARMLKEKWPLYFPPYHLFYFNQKNISLLLEKTGFSLLKAYPVQTYLKSFSGYRTFRYFKYPFIGKLAGLLFNDVVIYIAKPV